MRGVCVCLAGTGNKGGADFAHLERRRHHGLAWGDKLLVGAGDGLTLAIFPPPVARQLMMRPDTGTGIIDAQGSEDRVAANRQKGKHSSGLMNHRETIHILWFIILHVADVKAAFRFDRV